MNRQPDNETITAREEESKRWGRREDGALCLGYSYKNRFVVFIGCLCLAYEFIERLFLALQSIDHW